MPFRPNTRHYGKPMHRLALLAVAIQVVSATLACNGRTDAPSIGPTVVMPGGGADRLFADDFESGTLDAWQDGFTPALHRVVTDQAMAQSGSRYLAVTFPQGRDGGWLTRFFMPGGDSAYVSYYVRLPAGWRGAPKLVAFYG